jgi:hypothetical protein
MFRVGLVASALAASLLLVSSAVGIGPPPVTPVASFSGASLPARLPRGHRAPIGLSAGFTSEDPAAGPAPELGQITIELSPRVSLRTAGRPLCRERLLYKAPDTALEECRGSLVGRGTVVSDIPTSPYGEQTARVEGAMRVFYGLAEGTPMLLARVETGEPMPLVYVIPFQIERSGSGATRLVAHKMRNRRGRCARGHPNCFADPYGVDGIYARVAGFELALRAGHGRTAFLRASCPSRSASPSASFVLERFQLRYADIQVPPAEGAVNGACR